MKLTELFEDYNITNEESQWRIAYLLADFGCLTVDEVDINDDGEEETREIEVDPNDLNCYDFEDFKVSEYDLECGAYHNHIWFSFKAIIRSLVDYENTYSW